jgi:7-carboxy-7-deazaguanine synthase
VTYTVKEIFLTAQGEGANIGRTAVFIRFAGCNLWSGREEDRAKAVCRFCDTDFVGGGRFADAGELADAAAALWPNAPHRMTVLTGGEPLLQVDSALIAALRARAF